MNRFNLIRLKFLLKKNTHYENIYRGDTPTPYIMTNAKDYYKIMKLIDKLLGGK